MIFEWLTWRVLRKPSRKRLLIKKKPQRSEIPPAVRIILSLVISLMLVPLLAIDLVCSDFDNYDKKFDNEIAMYALTSKKNMINVGLLRCDLHTKPLHR